MKMTIKEEYRQMKHALSMLNERSGWDDTKYIYEIEHFTKRSKTEFLKLLNKDFEDMNFDMKYGFITVEQYNRRWKIWNDCSRSIANMSIYQRGR